MTKCIRDTTFKLLNDILLNIFEWGFDFYCDKDKKDIIVTSPRNSTESDKVNSQAKEYRVQIKLYKLSKEELKCTYHVFIENKHAMETSVQSIIFHFMYERITR